MNRRHALTLAAAEVAAGCRRSAEPAPPETPNTDVPASGNDEPPPAPLGGQSLLSVEVDPSREIRRIAGLRPFRPSGFVVRREDLDGKILQLPETVLFNCSGLGAAGLFGDSELIPIKGQLSVLLPQPGVDYNLISGDRDRFPRSDGIILGGT